MRSRILLSILLLALTAATSVPARAFDGPCRRSARNNDPKTCIFPFRETPITLRAETTATNARVRGWITVRGYPELPPLGECQGSGAGYAECSIAIPDSVTALDVKPHPLVPSLDLVCNFEGNGDWTFGCDAGR